jgi:ketosteroid isomerase-like protein
MSRENVDIMRRGFDDYITTGDLPLAIIHEAVEVHDHDTPDQGVYRGHAGYARWLVEWGAAWSSWTLEPEEFIDAGECVVVVIRLKALGHSSGIEVERHDGLLFTLAAGKIVRLDYFNNKPQALDAVGLAD